MTEEKKTPPIWNTPQGYFDAWKRLRQELKSTDETMLKLLTHPEATDEQILEVVKLRGASNRKFLEMTYGLSTLLERRNRQYLLDRMHQLLGVTSISKPQWMTDPKNPSGTPATENESAPQDPCCDNRDNAGVMARAHALCPTDLPHLKKMQWMANYYEANRQHEPEQAQQPASTGPKL